MLSSQANCRQLFTHGFPLNQAEIDAPNNTDRRRLSGRSQSRSRLAGHPQGHAVGPISVLKWIALGVAARRKRTRLQSRSRLAPRAVAGLQITEVMGSSVAALGASLLLCNRPVAELSDFIALAMYKTLVLAATLSCKPSSMYKGLAR